MPDVTRIIEQTATESIYNDDWLIKDSVNQGTTKIQPSVLKAWINDGMATVEELETVVGNIADTYNTSESYVVDDLCIHEYALYKCIGATTGPWDSTKWQATTLAEIIATIDLSAEAISYDNTSSGLEAENVQDAIGETITKLSAVGSASGAIATFDDGSDLPMPSLKVSIEPVQSGSGEPSPTNVRPISGWDEVNVSVCGNNLLPLKFYKGLQYNDSIGNTFNTEELTDGTISGNTVSFNIGGWGRRCMLSDKLSSGAEYRLTMTVTSSANNLNYTEFYLDKDLKITRKYNIQNSGTSRTVNAGFILNDNECYIAIELGCSSSATIVFDSPMLNVGSTPTTYEPYNGQTYNIQFKDGSNPLTVYGGSIDVVSGVLTVDRAYVDLGSLTWTYRSTQNVFSTEISGLKRDILICSNYKYTDVNRVERMNDGEIWDKNYAFSPTNVIVKDLRYTSASDFQTAMNGVQLVYNLATPITIQLTPTQVKSLLGVNNIWADTGNVLDAEYIRDTTTVINSLIARIEALENQ